MNWPFFRFPTFGSSDKLSSEREALRRLFQPEYSHGVFCDDSIHRSDCRTDYA